jgi:ankyrin repeat protein
VKEQGKTELHLAASRNEANTVASLLTRGSNVCARDLDGRYALHLACLAGAAVSLQALVRAHDVDDLSTPDYVCYAAFMTHGCISLDASSCP